MPLSLSPYAPSAPLLSPCDRSSYSSTSEEPMDVGSTQVLFPSICTVSNSSSTYVSKARSIPGIIRGLFSRIGRIFTPRSLTVSSSTTPFSRLDDSFSSTTLLSEESQPKPKPQPQPQPRRQRLRLSRSCPEFNNMNKHDVSISSLATELLNAMESSSLRHCLQARQLAPSMPQVNNHPLLLSLKGLVKALRDMSHDPDKQKSTAAASILATKIEDYSFSAWETPSADGVQESKLNNTTYVSSVQKKMVALMKSITQCEDDLARWCAPVLDEDGCAGDGEALVASGKIA